MFSFNNTEINSSYENRYLLVQIAENLYAFDINSVKEVLPMIEIFSPENSSNMIGVIKKILSLLYYYFWNINIKY